MTNWIGLEQAMHASGVRLILARFGVPSPWSEFCRAMFDVDAVAYQLVDGRDSNGGYERLRSVSAQESVPVVLIEDERPRSSWLEQLYAAERLASQPTLLPQDSRTRASVIGLTAELCGEGGFGWCRRLMMNEQLLHANASAPDRQAGAYLRDKYPGWDAGNAAADRCEEVVAVLAALLREQHSAGRHWFIGERVSALDLAWAGFAALLQPLPEAECSMPARWRELFTWTPRSLHAIDTALLLEHRDRIYRQFLTLPIPTR